jgi:hypothetical protein
MYPQSAFLSKDSQNVVRVVGVTFQSGLLDLPRWKFHKPNLDDPKDEENPATLTRVASWFIDSLLKTGM